MQVALVTGVSRTRGIAAAVAERLCRDGLAVVTGGWTRYHQEHMAAVADQVPTDLQIDLGTASGPAELMESAERRPGLGAGDRAHARCRRRRLRPDSGVDRPPPRDQRARLAAADASLRGVSTGPRRRGSHRDLHERPPQTGAAAYAASKGALEWITYSAETELGPHGIRVNAINPGPNQTGWMSPETEREAAERTPLRRTGRPQDAAALVSICSRMTPSSSTARW